MTSIQNQIIKDLMKLSRRYEIAIMILFSLTLGFAIALAAVLIFTPNC